MSSSARWFAAALLLASCSKADDAPPTPELQEARRLLAEAGFPGGRGFPRLTILYNTQESHKKIASAIQDMWRRGLGVDVELRNVEWTVMMDLRDRGEFDIIRSGYTGEYADPHALVSLFATGSGFNTGGWSNPEFDRLVAASDLETDPSKRYALLGAAEKILLDDSGILPIYHLVGRNLLRPFVKGVHPNSRDLHPLQGVTLEGPGAPADGVLIFNAGSEPQSLDPALSHDIAGLKVLMHLFEGLVSYDPVDAHPVPAMAERWDVSEDGRTWTFHLRSAKWSNGDPVTARDFEYAWRRVVTPATGSTYSHRMFDIVGAREVVKGADPATFGARAVDDRTFEVRLVHRVPYFLQLLCLNIFLPVHRPTVEGQRDWTTPGRMVVNGPYLLKEREHKVRKVFVKNPGYRDAAAVKLEKFIFLSVDDSDTAFRMYEGGQIHWLFTVPLAHTEQLKTRPDHMANPYNSTYFYVFNLKKKPLDDRRVRNALSLAVDTRKICDFILRGGEPPARRLTPLLYPGYVVR